MTPLSLSSISRNAFRILGLTSDASQAEVDGAARKMRIWPDPSRIPATANDAPWMGPVPRSRQDIENAVVRLANPLSRLEERFWWFCLPPPPSDDPADTGSASLTASHDAALLALYRCLVLGVSEGNGQLWKWVVEHFKMLAASDDYLQWLLEVEDAGQYEKRAVLDEIAAAQQQLPAFLSSAITGSVQAEINDGNIATTARVAELVQTSGTAAGDDPAHALLDRLEDDLLGRCNELVEKVNVAWRSGLVSKLRPACNHAIARFGTIIRPLIDQMVTLAQQPDRQDRAKMHGVELLIHVADGYGAIDNHLAAQRTLDTALELAKGTSMELAVKHRLNRVEAGVQRQRAGVPQGLRQPAPGQTEFKLKPGGKIRDGSGLSFEPRFLVWCLLIALVGVARVGCHPARDPATEEPDIPRYDSAHGTPFPK